MNKIGPCPRAKCGRRPCSAGLIAVGAVVLLHQIGGRALWHCGPAPVASPSAPAAICALLPPPQSAPFARAPSVAHDRWPLAAPAVSVLPEPVERPLDRYLYKRDGHYNRIVPDWTLQYRTVEQQYLYEGDFAVFVREITDEGAVVQDAVTGIVGFAPHEHSGKCELVIGSLLLGARCTKIDTTVVMSPDVTALRMQTGIVFEWDEIAGEGYIIPTEGQDAWRMLRVMRRDIQWHDSRRLFVGQFVQFETALNDEVLIEANDEPLAPFALRVRSPEVHFSLHESYESRQGPATSSSSYQRKAPRAERSLAVARFEGRPLPAESGRPVLGESRAHPVLQRWLESYPARNAESPAWLWEPAMEYMDDEDEDLAPIIPLQLKKMKRPEPVVRIMTHEVAADLGDLWKEPAQREGSKVWATQKPPGRRLQETMTVKQQAERLREIQRERRRWKMRAATLNRRN